MNWNLTAQHRTSTRGYYITKSGWDPTKPLKIEDFKLIKQIDDNSAVIPQIVKHNIDIPKDEKGYNVILATQQIPVYQAIDVKVK
ncbi:lytic polysaccharide monooxygenase [Enterococcus mundtii]|uniref:lytic polysaccharide monooxygenase n=1 Tax=Enterococcus mundtii TaxID=53346 RepID=UPI0021B0DAAD|nr:lytic polysaccharide monooxygenase [Enterococcus mundtii]